MRHELKMLDLFNEAYEELAECGHCDSPGGSESRRVRSEFVNNVERLAPEHVKPFVAARANYMPTLSGTRHSSLDDIMEDGRTRLAACEFKDH